MTAGWEVEEERLTSLALVLPLALMGFAVASGCWTLFAVTGVHVRTELSLTDFQFGFLLAAPMAVSAFLGLPAGLAAQRFGARQVMLACLSGLALSMALLLVARSYNGYLLAAGGLGLAGGYYCAGIQFVTTHCRPRRLGLVLGAFGSGVTGAGFNYYLVPLFNEAFSWRGVALAYLVVLLLVLVLIVILTPSEDGEAAPNSGGFLSSPLSKTVLHYRHGKTCAFFGVVAGSFFALALWLPDYLSSQFSLNVHAGAKLSQWFVIPGALAQIAGGALADRYGSTAIINRSLIACLVSLFILSYPPMTLLIQGKEALIEVNFALPLFVEAALILSLGLALGSAIGGLQRLAILDSPASAALTAGLMLVSACSVAFLLPLLFSGVNHWLGVRTSVFMVVFLLLAGCVLCFAHNRRQLERQSLSHRGMGRTYHQ